MLKHNLNIVTFKVIFIFCIIQICSLHAIYVSANSEAFLNNIMELGVPRYNTKGEEINEDIYLAYTEYVYGTPTKITSGQRWKDLSNGAWTKNGGRYTGSGIRGEYEVLGYNYSGGLVYNYYFPLDGVVKTPIKNWIFLTLSDAYASWQKEEYTKAQLDYAKTASWWFENLDNPKHDPYDQIDYGLNAVSVGLNKARLETAATWKSKGSIYVERRTEYGTIAWANFAIEPMAANADVQSSLNINSEYILEETQDELHIIIKYGASIINMTEYASVEDIKDITCTLLINGDVKSQINKSKVVNMSNEYVFVVSRDKYTECKKYSFEVEVKSTAKTKFALDGILQSTVKKTFTIEVAPKQIPLENSNLKNISVENNKWNVSILPQTIETTKIGSQGFSEAGRNIAYLVHVNNLKGNIGNLLVLIDGNKVKANLLSNINSSDLVLIISLPTNLKTTLYGYKSLREKYGSYLDIHINELLSRKTSPHELKISFSDSARKYEDLLYFDTMDDYFSNINLDVRNKITNLKDINYVVLEGIKVSYE